MTSADFHHSSYELTHPPPISLVLGDARMDETHVQFAKLISAALTCADTHLLDCLSALHEHLIDHLGLEDTSMRETNFPAAQCHLDEHRQVVLSSEEVALRVVGGDNYAGHRFVKELADWFPRHVVYQDAALAAWLSKCRNGGSPVVIHRK
jgi:hemerythrin